MNWAGAASYKLTRDLYFETKAASGGGKTPGTERRCWIKRWLRSLSRMRTAIREKICGVKGR